MNDFIRALCDSGVGGADGIRYTERDREVCSWLGRSLQEEKGKWEHTWRLPRPSFLQILDSVLPTWIYPSRFLVYLLLPFSKMPIVIEHHLWFGVLLGTWQIVIAHLCYCLLFTAEKKRDQRAGKMQRMLKNRSIWMQTSWFFADYTVCHTSLIWKFVFSFTFLYKARKQHYTLAAAATTIKPQIFVS